MNIDVNNLMRRSQYSFRLRVALLLARIAGEISRKFRLGAGVALAGKVLLLASPTALVELSKSIETLFISATNGKTTTTALCAASLASLGPIATNGLGNNMSGGIAISLASEPEAKLAVLEVDEAHLGDLIKKMRPTYVVLMNLSRDQLDRVSEVRNLAQKWANALYGAHDLKVIANISDPLVHFATREATNIVRIELGLTWNLDAIACPICDGTLIFTSCGRYGCISCDFGSPAPDYILKDRVLLGPNGFKVGVYVELPGEFNIQNAAMALCLANEKGIATSDAQTAISSIRSVSGRYQEVEYKRHNVTLLMAKNPAGWSAILETFDFNGKCIVLGLNAEIADGKDTSWIYDVDFAKLKDHEVKVTSKRAYDLAVRLGYAGINCEIILNQLNAIDSSRSSEVIYIGNYTAFQKLRRHLGVS